MLKNSTKCHEKKNRCCHRKSDPQPHREAPSIAERLGRGGSQIPRQGDPLRERWEELAHEFLRKMNVYNL